jgi:hypothetical protein
MITETKSREIIERAERRRLTLELKGYSLSISLPSEGLVQKRFSDKEEIVDNITKELYVLPAKYTTKFKNLRSKVYNDIVPKYAFRVHSFYFLPEANAAKFLDAMEEIRDEYILLQVEIDDYLLKRDDEWLKKVDQYSTVKNLQGFTHCPDLVSKMRLDIFPLDLGPRADPDSDNRMDIILHKEYKEIVRKSAAEIQDKLRIALEKLTNIATSTNVSTDRLLGVKKSLADLQILANSANLDEIIGSQIKTTALLAEALQDKTSTRLPDIVSELATHLGYEGMDTSKPEDALLRISLDMKKDISPKLKALLDEL